MGIAFNSLIALLVFSIIFLALGIPLMVLAFMIDSIVRGHDLPTSRRTTKNLIRIISEHTAARNFYDLGCGHGKLSIRIKRSIPKFSVIAVDNSPIRILSAKIMALFFWCHIQFMQKNIFDVDVSDADIVYTYLWYDLMSPLEQKLQKELRSGAIVVTNTSNFPTWKPTLKILTDSEVSETSDFETLFVYIKE